MKISIQQLTLLVASLLVPLTSSTKILSFDYIVIGGGIGGGTVALQLAKKSNSVLLIEAGPDYNSEIISTPFYHTRASTDENISFNYPVQYYSNGYLSNKTFVYPRVGNLGGCSRHNAMIAVLPTAIDYKRMVNITGDESWSEKRIRNEYFVKLENNSYPEKVNQKDHGFKGWLPINYMDYNKRFKLDEPLKQVYQQTNLGNSKFVDINGYDEYGKLNTDKSNRIFVPTMIDSVNYQRYDLPKLIRNSKNLTIWTDTLVTKLILDSSNKKVLGLEYAKGRYIYKASPLSNDDNRKKAKLGKVYVNKEVVLSAGAFNSPQLLMLSGIGPKNQLAALDLKVKVDLPGVGRNLMDKHVVFLGLAYKHDFNIYANCKFTTNVTDPCFKSYKSEKSGPYVTNGVMDGELFNTGSILKQPDIFSLQVPGSSRGFTPRTASDSDSNLKVDIQYNGTLTRLLFKAQPKDTGYITLNSTSPYDTPTINFDKFKDTSPTSDLVALVKAVKHIRRQFNQLDQSYFELLPGKNVQTDQQIENYLRESMTGFHICCTNKIGKDADPYAVLDKQFKVRGINNLRVVDASAFPSPPGYFPALYTHLQSMKVTDMILNN